jgi:hypothetical protein
LCGVEETLADVFALCRELAEFVDELEQGDVGSALGADRADPTRAEGHHEHQHATDELIRRLLQAGALALGKRSERISNSRAHTAPRRARH